MIRGFKQFILRGNVVDLAVGIMIGASFTAIVNALVKDIMTPFISLVTRSPDFSKLSFSVNGIVFNFGNFINAVISFLIVAGVTYFFIVVPINHLIARVKKGEKVDPSTKKCEECLSEIPIGAKKCAFCASLTS